MTTPDASHASSQASEMIGQRPPPPALIKDLWGRAGRIGTRPRAVLLVAAFVAVLAAAAVALALAADRPAPLDRRVASVAAGLRCPTCAGQSVADSEAPMARSMREVVRQQLAAGRTPAEVRSWFAARYGPTILLDPPARGPGALLVAGPVVLLLAGSALAVRAARGRRPGKSPPSQSVATPVGARAVPLSRRTSTRRRTSTGRRAAGATALVAGVVVLTALAYRAAVPASDPRARAAAATVATPPTAGASALTAGVRAALARLEARDFAGAERLARAVLRQQPDDPDALLVLGLAQRATGSSTATATLRRFVAVAPTHAAAPEVRQFLQRGAGK